MKMRMRMCVRGVFAVKLQLAASNTFDRGLLSPELLGEQSGLDYAPMPKKNWVITCQSKRHPLVWPTYGVGRSIIVSAKR